MVLRITKYDGADPGAILRIDGRLVAERAAILERHCAGLLRRPEGLNLDLVGISFVDRAGAEPRCPSGPVASVLVGADVRVVLDAEPAEPAEASVSTALRNRSSHPLFATTIHNHLNVTKEEYP